MSKDFIRQDYMRHLRLGKKRKKLRKWRRPKGRHSKMRLKRKSYPKKVSIGRRKLAMAKTKNLKPILINNPKELEKIKRGPVMISRKVGTKKKIELIKIANEKNIQILNMADMKKNET